MIFVLNYKMVVISTIHSDDDPDNLIQSNELQIPSHNPQRDSNKIEADFRRHERRSEYDSRQSHKESLKEESKSYIQEKTDRTPPQSTGRIESANRKAGSSQESDHSRSRNQVSDFREDTEPHDQPKKGHRRTHSGSEKPRASHTEESSGHSPSLKREEELKKPHTPDRTGSHHEPTSQASGSPQGIVHSSSQSNVIDKELLQKTLQLNQYYQKVPILAPSLNYFLGN